MSMRKRIPACSAQQGIAVPAQFLDLDRVYAMVLMHASSPENVRPADEQFYNVKMVMPHPTDHDKNLAHHRILDFRQGIERVLDGDMPLKASPQVRPPTGCGHTALTQATAPGAQPLPLPHPRSLQ